jgi:hypothetical protein
MNARSKNRLRANDHQAMHATSMTPKMSRALRITMFPVAALVLNAAPLHGGVADTVGVATSTAGRIVGIPFGILTAAAKGVSKVAKKTVTKHVTKS